MDVGGISGDGEVVVGGRGWLGSRWGRSDDWGRGLVIGLWSLFGSGRNFRFFVNWDFGFFFGNFRFFLVISFFGGSRYGDFRNRNFSFDDSDSVVIWDGGIIFDIRNSDGSINDDSSVGGRSDDGSVSDSNVWGNRFFISDDGGVFRDFRCVDVLESLDSFGNDVVGFIVGVDVFVNFVDKIGMFVVVRFVKVVFVFVEDGDLGV